MTREKSHACIVVCTRGHIRIYRYKHKHTQKFSQIFMLHRYTDAHAETYRTSDSFTNRYPFIRKPWLHAQSAYRRSPHAPRLSIHKAISGNQYIALNFSLCPSLRRCDSRVEGRRARGRSKPGFGSRLRNTLFETHICHVHTHADRCTYT